MANFHRQKCSAQPREILAQTFLLLAGGWAFPVCWRPSRLPGGWRPGWLGHQGGEGGGCHQRDYGMVDLLANMKQLIIEVLIPPWRGFSLSAPGLGAGRARRSFGADEDPFRHFPRTSKGIFLFFVYSLLAGSSTHQWMIFAAKNNRYRCFWILLCACFQEPDAGFTWHNGLTFIFKGTHTAQLTSWDLPIWMFPTKKCDQNSWQKLFKHFKCLIIKKTNMFQK